MDKGHWVPNCPHMGWNTNARNQSRTVSRAYPGLVETEGSWQYTAAAPCWRSAANLPSTEVKCFCPSSSPTLQQQWELKCTSKAEPCRMGDELTSHAPVKLAAQCKNYNRANHRFYSKDHIFNITKLEGPFPIGKWKKRSIFKKSLFQCQQNSYCIHPAHLNNLILSRCQGTFQSHFKSIFIHSFLPPGFPSLRLPKHWPLVSNLSLTKRAFLLAVWISEMSDITIGLYINKIRKVKAGKAKWKALKKAKLFGPKETFLFVGKHLFPTALSPLLPFFVPAPFFSLVLSPA